MEKKERYSQLNSTDNIRIKSEIEVYEGVDGDTKIEILETGILCHVSGSQRQEFLDRLNSLIDEYRI